MTTSCFISPQVLNDVKLRARKDLEVSKSLDWLQPRLVSAASAGQGYAIVDASLLSEEQVSFLKSQRFSVVYDDQGWDPPVYRIGDW